MPVITARKEWSLKAGVPDAKIIVTIDGQEYPKKLGGNRANRAVSVIVVEWREGEGIAVYGCRSDADRAAAEANSLMHPRAQHYKDHAAFFAQAIEVKEVAPYWV